MLLCHDDSIVEVGLDFAIIILHTHEYAISLSFIAPDTTWQRRPPPPAFATTSTETIDFSIGFGFAALIYVSL
jgi:hypothetical protein